jgi:hypothetical protein
MSKKPAFNGIDYTPRTAKAIAAAGQRPMDRHMHGVVQHKQRYPIYEVTAAGKTVEWTDHHSAAVSAFAKVQALPKLLCMVHEDGRRLLLDGVSQSGMNASLAQVALAA